MDLEKRTLNECLQLVIDRRGVTPKKLGSNWTDNGYRVLSANNVKSNGLQKQDEIRCVDEETYHKWMKNEIQRGDILLTSEAPAGEVWVWDSDEKIVVGQRLYALRVKKEVNPWYLAFYLQSRKGQAEIANKCSGSTVFGISAAMFDLIEVLLPDKETQDKIANITKDIMQKISFNKAKIAMLKGIADVIFNFWFMQFDFPDENGKPYKSSGGKMIWNEFFKREIPFGWNVENIANLCQIVDCLHSKKPRYHYESERYYMLTLENLTREGLINIKEKYYISKQDYELWTSRIEVKKGDFVVTNAGRAGDIGRIPAGITCAIGRNLTAIRPTYIDSDYFNMFLHSEYIRQQILTNLDAGSFFSSFNVKSIKNVKILVPGKEVLEKFVDYIHPMIQQIDLCNQQNYELVNLRDFLLPLLMNGQVTFKGKEV